MTEATDSFYIRKDDLPLIFAYHSVNLRHIIEPVISDYMWIHCNQYKPSIIRIKFFDFLNTCINYDLYKCCMSSDMLINFENARSFLVTWLMTNRVAKALLADFKGALRLYTIELLLLSAYFNRLFPGTSTDVSFSQKTASLKKQMQDDKFFVFVSDLPKEIFTINCGSDLSFRSLDKIEVLPFAYSVKDLPSFEEAVGILLYQFKFDYKINPLAEIGNLYQACSDSHFSREYRQLFWQFRYLIADTFTTFPYDGGLYGI